MPDPKDLLGSYYAGMSDQELQAIERTRESYAPHIRALVAREMERRGMATAFAKAGPLPRPKPLLTASASIHCGLLGAVRSVRHWRVRLFHGRAEWVTDLTSFFGYVNFLQLLPTLSAIAFVPDRFAPRVASLVDRKHHLYLGPVKYVSTWISFVLAFLVVAGIAGASRVLVSILVLLISLFSPIWITAYLAFVQFWIFWFQRFENCKGYLLPVVLRINTYRALSWRSLFWLLLYFGGYLSVVVMVCGALDYVVYWVVPFVFGSDRFALRLTAIAMGLVTLWSAKTLVMPQWIAVLRSAVRSPTQEMIRADARGIAEIALSLLKREEAGDESTDDLRSDLVYYWPFVRRALFQEELQATRGGRLAELLRDRSVLRDVFAVVSELLPTCDRTPKLEQMDADFLTLCAGLSLRDTSAGLRGSGAPRLR